MGLPDDVYKNMKRIFPDADIPKPVDFSKTVPKRKCSKTLKPFDVEDVIALKEFDGPEEIEKGDVCQVSLCPSGDLNLGFFGRDGGGTVYKMDAIEGTDFNFKP